jgi:predicted NBD/HSP70 family sugar kinase
VRRPAHMDAVAAGGTGANSSRGATRSVAAGAAAISRPSTYRRAIEPSNVAAIAYQCRASSDAESVGAASPRLTPPARVIVDRWIHESTEALVSSFVAINCLINPEAILIGGRLPAILVDQLAASLNTRMAKFAAQIPAIAPVARALTADDAPAVGAAILPFSYRLLPTRFALLKTT